MNGPRNGAEAIARAQRRDQSATACHSVQWADSIEDWCRRKLTLYATPNGVRVPPNQFPVGLVLFTGPWDLDRANLSGCLPDLIGLCAAGLPTG